DIFTCFEQRDVIRVQALSDIVQVLDITPGHKLRLLGQGDRAYVDVLYVSRGRDDARRLSVRLMQRSVRQRYTNTSTGVEEWEIRIPDRVENRVGETGVDLE